MTTRDAEPASLSEKNVYTVAAHSPSLRSAPSFIISSLFQLWKRRELLANLTMRNIRSQYQQSFLGYAWAILNPLLYMLVLTLVFSYLLRLGGTAGVPFPLFLFVGLVPWLFFANSISVATESVTSAAGLITKVYFPREILPVAASLGKLVEFVIGLAIIAAFLVLYRWPFHGTLAWLPVILALHMVFTIGLALPLAALNLYYHDVRYLVGVALQLGMFLSPIFYSPDLIPSSYQSIYNLNPNTAFINAYRRIILAGESPDLANLGVGIGVTFLTFLVGYYVFKRLEGSFADVV